MNYSFRATSNLNKNSIVNEHLGHVNIDSNDKTQDINMDSDQNVCDETEVILTEVENVDGIGNPVQDIQNYDTSGTDQIKHSVKTEAPLYNVKKNKKIYSNNNLKHQMLKIKENTALREMKYEEKIIKPKVPTVFENMDETDIFFLSMSKMTKLLPKVEQAKIKLLLSNYVLQAEVKNTRIQASQPISSFIPSEAATSPQYSISEEEEEFN